MSTNHNSPVRVVVQEGAATDEQAVYSAPGGVRYEAVWVDIDKGDGESRGRVAVFVVFTPVNGHNRGHECRVPFDRVLAVVEDS
jgi:hypothetical protein